MFPPRFLSALCPETEKDPAAGDYRVLCCGHQTDTALNLRPETEGGQWGLAAGGSPFPQLLIAICVDRPIVLVMVADLLPVPLRLPGLPPVEM